MKKAQQQTVFISTTSFGEFSPEPVAILQKAGLIIQTNPLNRKLKSEEISNFISEVDFLIAGTEDLNRSVLQRASRLKVISRCGVGVDNVDLKAAQERGIKVFNTPGAPTVAVAELTLGLILNLLRGVSMMDRGIRAAGWEKRMGSLLKGKTVGIIGFGQIGKEVARLCQAFGAKICFCDPGIKIQAFKECVPLRLSDVFKKSDIVTLHLSYSKENHHLIGEKELSSMRKSAFLVNCARGGLIDEDALYRALSSGKITGAALDAFETEPYQGPLSTCANVILTPHIGSYAKEARIQMEIDSANNLVDAI